MKNTRKLFFTVFTAISILIIGLSGCASASKQYARRLRGTWNVVNYDIGRPEVRTSGISNYGTITFNKNGTGSAENASIFDNLSTAYRQGPYNFWWSNTENTLVIKGEGANVSKSWIVMTNKKSQQLWKSTDGANTVQTLELHR